MDYVILATLIEWLESQDFEKTVPFGFGEPHSYRGYYEQLAFKPASNAKIGDMYSYAKGALGRTFEGYKGGEYEMHDYTICWISNYGETSGDMIGPTMVKLWEYILNK